MNRFLQLILEASAVTVSDKILLSQINNPERNRSPPLIEISGVGKKNQLVRESEIPVGRPVSKPIV